MIPVWAKLIALGLAAYEGTLQLQETSERHEYWNLGRNYANQVGKPMLQIGRRIRPWEPPLADVVLDLDERVLDSPEGVIADERAIPFPDHYFGACYNSHTLEHLNSAEDIQQAINECCRVADYAIFLCPSPYGIISILKPEHKFRLLFKENNEIIAKRMRRSLQVGQVIVAPWDQPPQVVY